MAINIDKFLKNDDEPNKVPWHKRISLRLALIITTVLCTVAAFTLTLLETIAFEQGRDALYYKYITPYYATESPDGESYYVVSEDGKTLYIQSSMPYAYVDPDTGEIYPMETTNPAQFIPAGPLRFFYANLSEIAVFTITATVLLAFFADAWWFYHWKLKRPLAVLNTASHKIAQNDLDFHVDSPSGDELGMLCQSFETMRASLEENNRSLWAAVEERKRLNAAFSHDLRTPLTVLQGYSDFLLETLPSGDLSPEKTVETVLTMQRSLTRLQRYVESMNSLQRLGDLKPQKSAVPFSSLCTQLKETGEILWGDHTFSLKSHGEETVFLDSELLFQVYENLLSNAARYAKENIWATVETDGVYLTLTVRDDGPGFPPSALKRAMDPYYRADKSTSLEGEMHFGLGLYLCRVLCQKHGGSLQVANSPQGGAEITARFFVQFNS